MTVGKAYYPADDACMACKKTSIAYLRNPNLSMSARYLKISFFA